MQKSSQKPGILNNVFWKFGERILTQGISFIVSLILARVLLPNEYGVVSLVMIFISLADVFINSGFATSLIQKKDADALDFSTMFYCSFACSMLIYFLIYLFSPLIATFYENDTLIEITRVFALRIPLSCLYSIQIAYISRNMQFRALFFSSIIGQSVSGACGIIMAYTGLGVWALVAQNLSNNIVGSLVLLVIVKWYPQRLFSIERAKELMKFGSGILLADFSGTFFNNLRSLIIGKVYTSSDLAFYNKGQQLPQMISGTIYETIMAVMFPAMADEIENPERLKQMIRQSIQCLSCVICPVMFGLAGVMKPLVLFLYTEKWSNCVFYGQIYCMVYAFGAIGLIPLQAMKATGNSYRVLKLEVYKKPVYFTLLVAGVVLDIKAIAVTMLLYEIYGVIINFIQMRKCVSYSFGEILSDSCTPFILSMIIYVVVPLVSIEARLIATLLSQVICGVLIYIVGSVLLRSQGFYCLLEIIKLRRKKDND